MSKKKTVILSLLVMFLWGSLFPCVKLGYEAYQVVSTWDIIYFAGVRFTICGGIVCLYCLIRDRRTFLPAKTYWAPVLLSGVFAIILHYSFSYLGLQITDSSKTAILKQVGVLFYVCFSALFFKEDRLTLPKLIGVLLGFAGILMINASPTGIKFQAGDLLIIASSFCLVISSIISKKLFRHVEPITATGCSQFFGGIVLLIFGKIMGGNMQLSPGSSHGIMGYICLASIASYCIWYVTLKDSELSKLFIVKFAEPVFACICGAVLLGENIFRLQYLAAFALIALGITISNMSRRSPNAS